MIRLVIAVTLAVALFTAALPAIDSARTERAVTTITDDLAALDRAATDLLQTDAAVRGTGSRRIVTVTIPPETLGAQHTESVSIDTQSARVNVSGAHTHSVEFENHFVRPPGAEHIMLQTPADHELVLEPVWRDGERQIQIELVEERKSDGRGSDTGKAAGDTVMNDTSDPDPETTTGPRAGESRSGPRGAGESDNDQGRLRTLAESLLRFILV